MNSNTPRTIALARESLGVYVATNADGVKLRLGTAEDVFSPVDLLLAALAGCSSIDVDIMTSRRAEPDGFDVVAGADYHKDDTGNVLKNLSLTFDLTFPDGPDGDKARERIASAVQHSHDKSCTVSRTIAASSKVSSHIVGSDD